MKLETLEYKRLVRMSEVGATLVGRLPALAGSLLVMITSTVSALAKLAASQASAIGRVSEMARGKAIARAAVKSDVEAIYRTAAVVALENPGFDERFRKGLKGDQKLLTAARAAAEDAAPLAAAFINHAMPPDFLDALNAHIGNFERAAQDYAAATRACDSATMEIERQWRKQFLQSSRSMPWSATRYPTTPRQSPSGIVRASSGAPNPSSDRPRILRGAPLPERRERPHRLQPRRKSGCGKSPGRSARGFFYVTPF